ncbi:unannotated protein [freshwater metagenome]|uniref:Unannotated protein n=1 Tax=freshwater metagenome TaxID=449393 RepID=A0A6J7GKL6_9ZZZZ
MLHDRTSFVDWPEPERRRHLLRLWLRRDVGRPIVDGFGKNSVVQGRDSDRTGKEDAERVSHIAKAVVPDMDWGM